MKNRLSTNCFFSMARVVTISLCLALPWAGALVPRACFGFDSAEFNVTEKSSAAEAAAESSNILTITTYEGSDEGHLITFPDSTTMSIDCANGDIITKSHFHSDHCASCSDIGQYNYHRNNVVPGQVIYNKDGVTVTVVAANGYVIGQGSANVPCDPPDENPLCMALLVKYRGFDYLTGGDLYGSVERPLGSALKARGVHVDVLKISHHGTGTNRTSSLSYLQDISPEYATISGTETSPLAGGGTTIPNLIAAGVKTIYCVPDYNLPAPVPTQVYTANGNITITTDGCTFSFSGGNPYFYHGPYNVDDYANCNAPHLMITEAAISDSYLSPEDHRWVELYLPPGASPIDLSNLYWISRDHKGQLAKNGPLTMTPGDVAITHMTQATDTVHVDESDNTGKGTNGWWDLYTHISGDYWYSTDDCLMISKENSLTPNPLNIIDAVIWSNYDGNMPNAAITIGNYLITNFHWGNPIAGSGHFATNDQSAAVGSINNGYAQRTSTVDTDSMQDWAISAVNSEGTPPPAPTAEPTPPPPPKQIAVVLNKDIFSAGDSLIVDVIAQPITGRPFDAYAAIMNSGGRILYWIRAGNSLKSGNAALPIATKIISLPNGYSGTLLNVRVPPRSEGDYQVGVGLVNAGSRVKGVNSTFAYDIAGLSVR